MTKQEQLMILDLQDFVCLEAQRLDPDPVQLFGEIFYSLEGN